MSFVLNSFSLFIRNYQSNVKFIESNYFYFTDQPVEYANYSVAVAREDPLPYSVVHNERVVFLHWRLLDLAIVIRERSVNKTHTTNGAMSFLVSKKNNIIDLKIALRICPLSSLLKKLQVFLVSPLPKLLSNNLHVFPAGGIYVYYVKFLKGLDVCFTLLGELHIRGKYLESIEIGIHWSVVEYCCNFRNQRYKGIMGKLTFWLL